MGGKSPVAASAEQRVALMALAGSRDRGEANRARAVLLTLAGWTSPRIAEAFGVREDTVRLWRSDFGRGGVYAPKSKRARVSASAGHNCPRCCEKKVPMAAAQTHAEGTADGQRGGSDRL